MKKSFKKIRTGHREGLLGVLHILGLNWQHELDSPERVLVSLSLNSTYLKPSDVWILKSPYISL